MCTLEKRRNVFFLTLTGDDEHRINPTLIASLRSALTDAKSQSTRGSVLITTAQGKFFSNGMDFKWVQAAASASASTDRLLQMLELFKPVVADLFALPMPTIAAVTGHAAGAGFMLALSHDYVLTRSDRGVLYASKLDIGMTLPDDYMAFVRSKVDMGAARSDLLLRARKVKAEEAVAMGIVHSAHSSVEGTVEAAEMRKGMYPELRGGIMGLEKKDQSLSLSLSTALKYIKSVCFIALVVVLQHMLTM